MCLIDKVVLEQVFNLNTHLMMTIFNTQITTTDCYKKAKLLCSLYLGNDGADIFCIQFELVWKVQSSSFNQKWFHSWHLVVCKQSPFGP